MAKSGDEGFLHKSQLARRLRGFSFHFSPFATLGRLSKKGDVQCSQSAITGKIKIKYVMQILKIGAQEAVGTVRASASVMSPGWIKKFMLFYRMELKALGLMFRKMTFCSRLLPFLAGRKCFR